jgi:drug/metabolite transporter (DMT)-like permease
METIGVVVALVGIVTAEVVGYFTSTERMTIDIPLPPPPSSSSSTADLLSSPSCQVVAGSSSQLVGDMMCIVASFLNAMNIVWASRARRVLRLFSYTLSTTLIVTVTLAILSAITELSPPDFSPHGLLGWLSSPDMLLMISLFGFVVGCIGVLGQNYAVRYTSPVIFSTAQLLDPGLTAVMSWVAGLEGLPSVSTVLGVAMVGVGIGCVVVGENGRKREREDVHSYQAVGQGAGEEAGLQSSEGEGGGW